MSSSKRQRIEKVPGARRAKLTPAPGTSEEPAETDEVDEPGAAASGPNDERMRRDVPPHW
ncbi:MAG TPA: hypothetical protein VEX12_04330 [Microbacterium sp.]|nr:hypothetical protein [Microbacterium sp.]